MVRISHSSLLDSNSACHQDDRFVSRLRLLSENAAGAAMVVVVTAWQQQVKIVMSVVTAVTAQGAVATVTVVTAAAVTWR